MGTISEAIRVTPVGDGRFTAHADRAHQSITGMFGGWTTAVVLGSVLGSSTSAAAPSALTINFVGAIEPGSRVEIRTALLGGSRSIEHWNATVHEGDSVRASALVVLTNRRETEPHLEPSIPEVPDPTELTPIQAPLPQGAQVEMCSVSDWSWGTGDTRSFHWLRDANGRPLDHLLLAYLADQYAPRSFFWGVGMRPSATLTMSVYFHATQDELNAVGTDFILNEAIGTRGELSTSGQQARLWRRDGVLLATTEQLAWYR